jgi:hypothetical protein
VELHVENFYTDSAAAFSMTDKLQTELLKVDSPHLPDSVVKLLPQIRSKTVLMKHCLAHLLVSNVSADGVIGHSFLPYDFIALPQAINMAKPANAKPGKFFLRFAYFLPAFTCHSPCNNHVSLLLLGVVLICISAFNQALSRWRVLSFYLRPRAADDEVYIRQRDFAIVTAAETFCKAFHPLASRNDNDAARRENLVEVMKSAADTGILVFSQPSTFKYHWAIPTDARSSRKVVVTPAFVKVADENGQPLDRPQTMIQQVIEEI